MKKTILLLLFPFFSFAQNGVVKSVMLDSVMITAVKDGFSIEEFIHYIKTDTTFYQGFKNLRYYDHDYHSDLKVMKKSGEVLGSLFRSGKYTITNEQLVVHIDSTFDDGRIFNRKGQYRHYTPEFFDKIFFPKIQLLLPNLLKWRKRIEDENEQNEDDAKTIVFSIGSGDVKAGNNKNKKKLAVFDIDMQQYYDYLISQETFQDSLSVKLHSKNEGRFKKRRRTNTYQRVSVLF